MGKVVRFLSTPILPGTRTNLNYASRFDGVVSASLSPREDLEYVAALIEDGDTMESFENYIPRALDKAFQDHPKFTLGDHDFVIDMVLHQYDSSGWIDDMYVISFYFAVACFQYILRPSISHSLCTGDRAVTVSQYREESPCSL